MSTKDTVRVTLAAALTLLALYGLYLIRHVVLLVFVAAFVAIALEPGIKLLERFIKRRSWAVLVMIVVVVATLALFVASVVPPLAEQFSELVDSLPEYRRQLQDSSTLLGSMERRFDLTDRVREAARRTEAGLSNITDVLGRVGSAIADLLIVLALTVYFLLGLPRLKEQLYRLLPEDRRERYIGLIEQVFDKVGGWMEGNILISVFAGVASFIFLWIANVPFKAPLAMWVAIADLIPMIGATLGALVCVIVAFFASVPQGLITLAFFAVYQQIENYVISPRIMNRTIDVSPMAVIIAALVGATLLGVVGVLIAVPAAASLKVIARELWVPRDPGIRAPASGKG